MVLFGVIGRIFSRKFIKSIDLKLQRAGTNIYAEEFIGFLVIISIALVLLLVLLVYAFPYLTNSFKFFSKILVGITDENSILFFITTLLVSIVVVGILVIVSVWSYLDYKEEKRREEVETYLPDYLMLIAANIKSGVLIEHAVWEAAKPEFGLLSVEMTKIAKLAIGGKSFPEILEMFNARIGSRSIAQLVNLLNESVSSGGEIAKVLEQTANELRSLQILKREITSSLTMYSLFVLFAALIMTPLLFALSYNLVEMLSTVFAKVPHYRATISFSTISFSPPKISLFAFYVFSIVTILVTTATSLMMYGVFRNGHYSKGLRYFPFAVAFSLFLFIIFSSIFSKMFVVA